MTLDLPARLMTGWITAGLVGACGLVVEVVLTRHPALPAGGGIMLAGCLAAWYWTRSRRRGLLRAVTHEGDGRWRLRFADGRAVPAALLPGTRLLGRSLVLRWTAEGRVRTVWVTPWDVPDAALRRLAVRLRSTDLAPCGSPHGAAEP